MRIALVAALAAALLAPAGGPPVSPQTIFVDPLTTPGAQHATAVEPDTFAFGDTVVAAFQVGRYTDGGAAAIGWATSADGGRTWGSGLVPGLTAATLPGGPFTRVTDPAVAYDRVHGVWLVAVLALRGEDSVSSLVVTRSRDGHAWSPPATAAPEVGEFAHDKSWIACDSGRSSPHAGRCYVTWTDVASEEIVVARSRDGGLTWGEPVEVGIVGTGSQPVARPDGTLVVLGLVRGGLTAARSRDGGASFAPPVRVGGARAGDTAGMRAPPLPSVEVDRAGRIYAAWHHCGLSPLCSRHVVVLSSSADGAAWTPPVAIAAGPGQTILPGLGVDPTTSGPRTRLALAYYRLTEVGCPTASCIAPEYVSSSDAGSSWSAPVALAAARPIWMLAEARGRFAGDYVSTSFVTAGVAVPVVSAATAPPDGRVLHQAIVSAAIPELPASRLVPLTLGRAAASPARLRAGAAVTVSASLAGPIHGVRARCRASVGPSLVRAVVEAAGDGRARCTWRLPRGSSGKRLAGTIVVTAEGRSARRAFSFRVR